MFKDDKQRREFFASHPTDRPGAGYHPSTMPMQTGMRPPMLPAMTHPAGQMGVTMKHVTSPTPQYAKAPAPALQSLGNYLDQQKKMMM